MSDSSSELPQQQIGKYYRSVLSTPPPDACGKASQVHTNVFLYSLFCQQTEAAGRLNHNAIELKFHLLCCDTVIRNGAGGVFARLKYPEKGGFKLSYRYEALFNPLCL